VVEMAEKFHEEVKKVTIEFEDRTISVEGAEATKWQHACDSQATLSIAHGQPFPVLKWKVVWKRTGKNP